MAGAQSVSDIAALLRATLRAKYELRDAIYAELPLELLVLEWCGEQSSRESGVGSRESRVTIPASDGRSAFDTGKGVHQSPDARLAEDSRLKTPDSRLALDRVLEHWPAFLAAAAGVHPLLRPMLQDAVPLTIRDGTLFVLSEHGLAHDRLRDAAFRHRLEERLEAALGEKLTFKLVRSRELAQHDLDVPSAEQRATVAALATQAGAPPPAGADAATDILGLFGGEVVNPSGGSTSG
jgi:hypothetical protein